MISIDTRDSRPLYEQVVDGFRTLIIAGVMARDDKLPSVRSLATQLAINPNTIQRAYRELEAQGYTYSVAGKGSFVAFANQSLMLEERKKEVEADLEMAIRKGRSCGMNNSEILELFQLILED